MSYSSSRPGVVAVTNLFPNVHEPRRGLFNYQQLKALSELVDVRTVAPIAYFPLGPLLSRFASSGRARDLAGSKQFEGLPVEYPRYLYPPAIGRRVQGHLYNWGVSNTISRSVKESHAQIIYATWAYPDGFAAVRTAKRLGLPCVVKVHGSDVNDYLESGWRRRAIVSSLNRAHRVISVSQALKSRMVENGVREENIVVIYNGINRAIFKPGPDGRTKLGLTGPAKHILFVGNLKPVKGIEFLIDAMKSLVDGGVDAQLHIIGFGVLESALRQRAAGHMLAERVHFEGEKDQREIAAWMSASDLLCLPSVNEGVPNVILEALACGLPVVASRVGGIPEVVHSADAGILVEPRRADELAAALADGLARQWERARVTSLADRYSWSVNAEELLTVLQGVL